jgi:hypothetical protein
MLCIKGGLMSNNNYSVILRNLSNRFYHSQLSFQDYRAQRKIILDKIDEEFNGQQPAEQVENKSEASSIFMRTIQFFKNTDME